MADPYEELTEREKEEIRTLVYPEERQKSYEELLREAYQYELLAARIEEQAEIIAEGHRQKRNALLKGAKEAKIKETKLREARRTEEASDPEVDDEVIKVDFTPPSDKKPE